MSKQTMLTPSQVPEEWYNTDIKSGLPDHDVTTRRKATGFNELATEKENPFIQFIGYFRGPILYVMEIAVLIAAGLRDVCPLVFIYHDSKANPF